jgi:hypothetical protein
VSAAAFFDAARALKREMTGSSLVGLNQPEVDAFQEIIERWNPAQASPGASGSAPAASGASDSQEAADALSGAETGSGGINPTALNSSERFFASVHSSFGALTQHQVDGFNTLLQAFAVAAWPLAYAAYGLATAHHETNATMQPVREAYWLSEDWRKANLRYYPFYGRGFVQLTWERNYQHADVELGLDGKLVADPDMAMQPDIAAKIMTLGMTTGWFSGKKLGDYLPYGGPATEGQFTTARPIINLMDKAALIAGYAVNFQMALGAGEWE